jgi:pimeloyl-ACP methyl ester carboxylesterase
VSRTTPGLDQVTAAGFRRFDFDGPAGKLAGWTFEARSELTPILFIHPINLQGRCWFDVVPQLREPRLSLLPDLRGHGGSSPAGPYGVQHWAEDCIAVLDHFGVERTHVIGGSLGGPIAVFLAATIPNRIASIVSIGGALRIEGADVEAVLDILREKGVVGMFRAAIPEISVAPGTDPEIIESILAIANPNDVDTVWEVWKAVVTSDVTELAGAVTCPALVINGEFDRTCTPEQGAAMAAKLSQELVLMPQIGHLPMCEAPAALTALLDEHLRESEP